jgi:septal ring factor EnvC (AmiA/AmiB activator)
MDTETKQYLDLRFDNVEDKLAKIDQNQTELFDSIARHRELIGNMDTIIQVFKTETEKSLESGYKKFKYIEREINKIQVTCKSQDVRSLKNQFKVIAGVLSAVGLGFLSLAIKAVWDMITGG